MRIIPDDVPSAITPNGQLIITAKNTLEITDAEWQLILNGYLDEQHLVAEGEDGYIVYNEDMKGFKHFPQYLRELVSLKRAGK